MKDIFEEKIAQCLAEGRFVKAKLLKSMIEKNRLDYNFNIIDNLEKYIIEPYYEDYTYINQLLLTMAKTLNPQDNFFEDELSDRGFVLTKVDDLIGWARSK